MDISIIAAAVLPYLVKGGEKIAQEVGADLWELLKRPFTKEKDKQLLTKLENNPEDGSAKPVATYKIEEVLEEHPELAEKLQDVLKQYPSVVKHNQQVIHGNDNNAIQDVSGSSININRH